MDKGILVYYEWIEACQTLSPAEFHKLFFAMVDYQQNGTPPPEFKGVTKIIATLVFSQLKRRVDTSRAGKASAEKRQQEHNKTEEISTNNANDIVINSVGNKDTNEVVNSVSNYNKTKTKIKTIDNIPPIVPPLKEGENDIKDEVSDMFKLFWEAYPRKVSKAYSEKVFKKIKPSKLLFEKIMKALEEHKKNPDWQKQDGQFIPHASTWLNQRRWEDELQAEIKKEEQPKFKKQGVHL